MIPKVELKRPELSLNTWEDGKGNTYDIPTVIEYCKEQKYPVFNMPVAGLRIDYLPLDIPDIYSLALHCLRAQKADLSYPILLDDRGLVIDGYHRIVKALVEGKETIKAIRIQKMPKASGTT